MTIKTTAKILSVLFHPILYPIYSFLLLFFFDSRFVVQTPIQVKNYMFIVVVLNTLFIPVAMLYFLKRRKLITTYEMKSRQERIYPLVLFFVFYLSTWYLISRFQIFPLYSLVLALSGLTAFVALLLNFFFKISIHSLGIAAYSGALLAIGYTYGLQLMPLFVLVTLIGGLIASARLILHAHQPYQVYAGLFIGFVLGLFYVIS